jgi:hypothetical protein
MNDIGAYAGSCVKNMRKLKIYQYSHSTFMISNYVPFSHPEALWYPSSYIFPT